MSASGSNQSTQDEGEDEGKYVEYDSVWRNSKGGKDTRCRAKQFRDGSIASYCDNDDCHNRETPESPCRVNVTMAIDALLEYPNAGDTLLPSWQPQDSGVDDEAGIFGRSTSTAHGSQADKVSTDSASTAKFKLIRWYDDVIQDIRQEEAAPSLAERTRGSTSL